ncbi:MAG: hypothetical protein FK733_02635 [Asgard group archaeon]|nr:hypothetical protein [Asgard group archaeon]
MSDNGAIVPAGPALSLRVYFINGGRLDSAQKIVEKLKEFELEYLKADNYYEGFFKPTINGNLVEVEYYTGQLINIYTKNNGDLNPEPIYSQGKCEYIIHPKEKFLECRHTTWAAKKGLQLLYKALGVEFEPVVLSSDAMKDICKKAFKVTSVSIGGLDDDDDLSKFQLTGENVLETTYWRMYSKRGTIKAVKGLIDLNSGGRVNVRITNKGSMLVYRDHTGSIDVNDIAALNKMVLDLAKGS